MKNVLFVITCNGAGKGGHYHSLDNISRGLANVINMKIITIGSSESPVLLNNPYYAGSVNYNWLTLFFIGGRTLKKLKKFKPDIIHCFDAQSLLFISLSPYLWKKKFVYTQCGGMNENKLFSPLAHAVVLFSEENYCWYKSNRRFNNSRLYLIPNRIHCVEKLPSTHQNVKKDKNSFSFVKISRIEKYYKKGIIESLELVKHFKERQCNVVLYIIGVVQDAELFEQIRNRVVNEDLPVKFIHDDENTKQASKLLYLADAVIGTGRGAMEAMTLGIPTLAHIQNTNTPLPVLVSQESFNDLFKTNFSERGQLENITINACAAGLERLIINKQYYSELSVFSKSQAEAFFLIKNAKEKYQSMYSDASISKQKWLLLKNAIPFFYYYFKYLQSICRD